VRIIKIANEIAASEISLGCMRIWNMELKDASKLIATALEEGINFFDHADIYGSGKSEELFGDVMKDLGIDREKIYIQTKCGIRRGLYDFSKSISLRVSMQV